MLRRTILMLPVATALVLVLNALLPVRACCPAPREGQAALNADQTIVILWDAQKKMEHFIRKASFKSDAPDFGFLIPTPSQPQLDESGGDAFPLLARLTAPEIERRPRPRDSMQLGCSIPKSERKSKEARPDVRVLEERIVAGFQAAVLEADTVDVLLEWLNANGYFFSPEVKAWAQPYIDEKWKITALKVAKGSDAVPSQDLVAPALRMSFQTERPLFPYREPDPKKATKDLSSHTRLLRIYFIGEARYQGTLTKSEPWTGKIAWSNALKAEQRKELLRLLKLPETTGPQEFRLTEFEDPWPYRLAPADLYFSPDSDQGIVKRPPIVEYYDAPASTWPRDLMVYVLGLGLVIGLILMVRRWRRSA